MIFFEGLWKEGVRYIKGPWRLASFSGSFSFLSTILTGGSWTASNKWSSSSSFTVFLRCCPLLDVNSSWWSEFLTDAEVLLRLRSALSAVASSGDLTKTVRDLSKSLRSLLNRQTLSPARGHAIGITLLIGHQIIAKSLVMVDVLTHQLGILAVQANCPERRSYLRSWFDNPFVIGLSRYRSAFESFHQVVFELYRARQLLGLALGDKDTVASTLVSRKFWEKIITL